MTRQTSGFSRVACPDIDCQERRAEIALRTAPSAVTWSYTMTLNRSSLSAPVKALSEIHTHCARLRGDMEAAFRAIANDEILSRIAVRPYPYDTLYVIDEFLRVFPNEVDAVLQSLPNNWFVDIGGAHGEVSFLFDRAGFRSTYVDVLKEGHTFPHIAAFLREELGSNIDIITMDIDEAFDVGRLTSNLRARYGQSEKFGLAFFSGVFYHLKNPYRVLERLRETCHYCLMTTRVFSNLPTDGSD
jgi:hypothetical protein